MDEKLNQVIHKIELICNQNPEFKQKLINKLADEQHTVSIPSNSQLDEIYEYCIEKVVRKQAMEYYASFPIETIREQLIEDYCRMERFRRADNFGDFCLAAYQQIECICKTLTSNENLSLITKKLWAYPAYVYTGGYNGNNEYEPVQNISVTRRSKKENYRVADIVFPGKDSKTGIPYASTKYDIPLSSQKAIDIIRIVIYFVCYQASLKNSEYDNYRIFCERMNQLYQCRNLNHRGFEQTEWQKNVIENIMENRSYSYFVFLGELVHFVKTVSEGILAFPKLAAEIRNLSDKDLLPIIQGPKTVGKIELKDDGKKRFK